MLRRLGDVVVVLLLSFSIFIFVLSFIAAIENAMIIALCMNVGSYALLVLSIDFFSEQE